MNTTEQITAKILALNLDPIKVKLMDAEEGQGWSRAMANHAEQEYKRFLILSTKYPQESIAPSKDIDKFWHAHILDTVKYAEDCDNVFGYFLHHFPYFGMRGAEDAANLSAAADNMNRLYEQEFGQPMKSHDAAYCGLAAVSYCGAAAPSYCGAANVSYCGRVSYCGAAMSGQAGSVLNINSRPTL